jgi:preprotein translocase subunit SecD
MKRLDWRFYLIILFLLCSIYVLIPTVVKDIPKNMRKFFIVEPIKLGLDLQGGIHVLLEVDTKKAYEADLLGKAAQIKEAFSKKGLLYEYVKVENEGIVISTPFKEKWDEMEKIITKELFSKVDVIKVKEDSSSITYRLEFDAKVREQIEQSAVKQALETIRNRIDQFGVTEPIIHTQGKDNIVVELPGIKEPKRAIELMGKTAMLEFKLVREDITPEVISKGNIPPEVELIPERRINRETGEIQQYTIAVNREPLLTGRLLQDAQVRINNQFNQPYVWMKFNAEGARVFERVTGENVGKRMAVILDGISYSSPVIRDRISGGEAVIEGNFDHKEASDLAIVLRAGSLPAPVKVIQNITVGPTLGMDSIKKGFISALMAFIAVLVFMIIYYKKAGIIAISVLILNLLYLLAVVAAMRATLTLPGIAGIILMIGMGVDSNVLIFERIKEEFRIGKTFRNAIESGFKNAFWTIVDSHITTLITAAILFQFGTGPIKGFAVTLTIGIAINLFTVLVGTKSVYDYLIWNKKITKLSI